MSHIRPRNLKKGFILQSNDGHFEKIRRRAQRGEITFLARQNMASTLQICSLHLRYGPACMLL